MIQQTIPQTITPDRFPSLPGLLEDPRWTGAARARSSPSPGVPPRRAGRRPTLAVGWGLSALLHAGILSLISWCTQPAVVSARLDDSPSFLPVDIGSLAAIGRPAPTVAPAGSGASSDSVVASDVRARRRRPGKPAAAPAVSPGPQAPSREPAPSPEPAPGSGPPAAPADLEPAPAPPDPVELSPRVAIGLRVHEDFPTLPDSLLIPGTTHRVPVRICVSPTGQVDDVIVGASTHRQLADLLRATLATWRYRPYVQDRRAVPFCHLLSLSYVVH